MSQTAGWNIFIDVGGTFTDGIGVDDAGTCHRVKLLSSGALRGTITGQAAGDRYTIQEQWGAPSDFVRGFRFRALTASQPEYLVERYRADDRWLQLSPSPSPPLPIGCTFELFSTEETPILAARLLTGTPAGRPLPGGALRLATTLGTNALLERRGVPTALFITRGFRDLLRIGTQQRPDLFSLEIQRPDPLSSAVVEVDERLAADGGIVRPLDADRLAATARDLVKRGIRVAAVALLHGYRNPRHEQAVRDTLLAAEFTHVSCSADAARSIGLLRRAETAVVDAYLSPVVEDYLKRVASQLPGGRLHVMTSAGGLVTPSAFRPKDSLLSGPAGGVVGAAQAARRSGRQRVITFDMGGTSTDVARFDGDYEYHFETRIGDAHLVAPSLAIESVAAGGGSICWFDGDRLRVGPQSAGAAPGPACYGAGGPLTLTDVNLLLGRLDPARFEVPIVSRRAELAFASLQDQFNAHSGDRRAIPESILEGFIEIADQRMADTIRRISVRRGYDPADYALVAFGGAGGQHACGVAMRLDIPTILVPADAGLLSALGLREAVFERFAEEQVLQPLEAVEGEIRDRFQHLEREAKDRMITEGIPAEQVGIRRRLAHLRLAGQDATVEVQYRHGIALGEAFAARYAELYGHLPDGRSIEVESLRVVASTSPPSHQAETGRPPGRAVAAPSRRRVRIGQRWREVPHFERSTLTPGDRVEGPALIGERHGATVVDLGWCAEVDATHALVLRRRPQGGGPAVRRVRRPEAVRLELFTNRFRAIALEMGERLRRTAISTNIKERLDFSCALLDARGELIVNAPHIPVHLGAIGLCVRRVIETIDLAPGDVVATNHPACGGSHLPDVTVITPVHLPVRGGQPQLLGYVASRAHHAEIGGVRPGSMPFNATCLAEEAVVIPPLHLVRGGRSRWDDVRRLLRDAPYPSRAIDDNLADLQAAVAANHAGAEALRELAKRHGRRTVHRYMEALTALAERRIRTALRRLPAGRYEAEEKLDDGTAIRVVITLDGDRAEIDFGGTAPTHPGNLNATPAIVGSAVIYVLRLLLSEPLPLNEGLLRPVTLRIPRGLLNPEFGSDPGHAPAVTGGNVETSQRLVDTLLKALRIAACSQGTMNNIIFGTERFGYYETLGGGTGAGPGYHGASAVHSHMTNTRITDPEVIEHRYPVRVDRFAVRDGSGGNGRYRGGDGVVREFTFLEPMTLSILSQHRTVAPYGLEGGEPGAPGRQWVVRSTGDLVPLGSMDGCEVGSEDRLIVETPGGGGYGTADRGTE